MTLLLWILLIVVSNIGTYLILRHKIIHDLTCSGVLPVFVGYMEGGVRNVSFSADVHTKYKERYDELLNKVISHAEKNHGMKIEQIISEDEE